ncbi:hypothetical protein SASPL_103082 [Salvia splendens]|uniref:Alpha/beta hydrolase fold-3 domain-containing protein n=1 Tax=Salvia splendens TaxID=180675 RepID=A0A8X8YUZ7_SALSN|nr:hypothetical protein SASPL_103082 [Salvia splendens]
MSVNLHLQTINTSIHSCTHFFLVATMFYRYPCIICKFLSSALKDRFSNCPIFPGKLISEAEDAACDFDEEDEVFVSAVMTKYMESKCKRRSSSGAATRLCRCLSATSYNAFFSVKKRFSRSSSWNETGYRDLSKQSAVILELLQDEGWPFGLSKEQKSFRQAHPDTGVLSKDVTNIIPETAVYARIYLPKLSSTNEKLPLLVYYHGGAFLVYTPSSPLYHNFLNALVHESRVITVSVHYRRAPEHHLPVAYEDSLATLHWVASHCNGGNIVHNLAMAAGHPDGGLTVGIRGVVLVDPYFWGSDPIGSEGLDMEKKAYVDRLWNVVCPSCPIDDPWINPVATGGMSLAGLGCWRVLVTVAEKDILKDRGQLNFQALARRGWLGAVEIHETQGEDHCFHLDELEGEKAKQRLKKIAEFFKLDLPPMAFQ